RSPRRARPPRSGAHTASTRTARQQPSRAPPRTSDTGRPGVASVRVRVKRPGADGGEPGVWIGGVDGERPGVVAVAAFVDRFPDASAVMTPGRAVSARLVG